MRSTFGYTAGWNPYAADYSRYLPAAAAKRAGIFAGLGNFLSSTALQVAGAAAVTAVGVANWDGANPTGSYISLMPGWLGGITLLAIFIGAISANALNLYSAAMSFAAVGLRLPTAFGRAVIAVVVGLAGLVVAIFALSHVEAYEGFLLVIAYWIAPWLGVVFADRLLDKTTSGRTGDITPFTSTSHVNLAGPIAMAVAMVVSIFFFSNQQLYVGVLASAIPAIGDITFIVGFVLAFALYAVLRPVLNKRAAGVA